MDQPAVNIHEDLISRCKAGDQDAHYRLYKLYSKSMYNVGYRITRDEAEAEDVLQEAFISAFRNLGSYRGDSTFGAWLKRIVVNKAINALNKRKLETVPEEQGSDLPDADPPTDYGDELTVERVKSGIEQLPDGYRQVLSLYLLEGYDHQEIGQILGISESTSKSQLNRAKHRLRESLRKGLASEDSILKGSV